MTLTDASTLNESELGSAFNDWVLYTPQILHTFSAWDLTILQGTQSVYFKSHQQNEDFLSLSPDQYL